jgi:hypothetical protein
VKGNGEKKGKKEKGQSKKREVKENTTIKKKRRLFLDILGLKELRDFHLFLTDQLQLNWENGCILHIEYT